MRQLARSRVPFTYMLFVVALLQGLDYILRPDTYAASLIDTVVAWHWYGWPLMLAGIVGLGAVTLRRYRLAIHAHVVALAIYTALAAGYIANGFSEHHPTYGWALTPVFLFMALLHGIFATVDVYRVNPEPLQRCPTCGTVTYHDRDAR